MNSEAQLAAIAKLEKLKVGALFMEMGTGKTKVALDLMASRIGKVNRFLWFCPLSLKGNFEEERLKWHPELIIEVVGIETLSSSQKTYLRLLEAVKTHSTFCVIDESLKIKNLNANRTKRLLAIGAYCKYKLILNGTPISKNILDLWAQMDFLSPIILNMTFREFKYTYCEFKKEPHRRERIIRTCNLPHLMAKIEPYIFDAKLYLDIPKLYKNKYYCVDISAYEDFKEELFLNATYDDYGQLMEFSWYEIITKLQRWYTSQQEHYDAINEAILKTDGLCVVFVKYRSTIPENALALTGDIPPEQRYEIISRHKEGEQKALWVTYGLGSFGLNLQYCHTIIFAEHSWDYAQRIQAEARIYRTGQTEDCNFIDIVANTGLEKMLHDCKDKKENLSDRVKREMINAKKLKEQL